MEINTNICPYFEWYGSFLIGKPISRVTKVVLRNDKHNGSPIYPRDGKQWYKNRDNVKYILNA